MPRSSQSVNSSVPASGLREGPHPAPIPFEDALKKLESLVAEMESGDLPLDTMMKDFEEGRKLVALCTKELDGIKQRIEKVTAAGGTEPLEVK